MQLSVIIVNYNVKFFLEQCLHSVLRAGQGLSMEVWVVDNNSTDGSMEYLQPLFPQVKFIALDHNPGFARANNLALEKAVGAHILFLNPDTIVPESCFHRCLEFFGSHFDAGALGIQMVDGSGTFLKESKRGFPSPLTSFYKLSGLVRLFPRSKRFARYYLGHLDRTQDHAVEVLAGAFMMFPKKVLDEIGGFDTRFFMYGEDIDLSYRVLQGGYKNYYLAGPAIIHFKGESTKKGSLNYIKIFYQAMILFVQKHYKGAGEVLFQGLLQVAIWLRALLSALSRFLQRLGLPLVDMGITWLVLAAVMHGWYTYVRPDVQPEPWVVPVAFPAFSCIMLVAGWVVGLYDKWYKPLRAFSALMSGVLIILAVYSLLPEQYRFSRGIITVAGFLSAVGILLLRFLLIRLRIVEVDDESNQFKQTAVAGSKYDFVEVEHLLRTSGSEGRLLGRLLPSGSQGEDAMGSLDNAGEVARRLPFRELVFCLSSDLNPSVVIDWIQANPGTFRFKFHERGSGSLVGSDSLHTSGEVLSAASHFHLAQEKYTRAKRVLDVAVALLILLSFPLQLLVQRKPLKALANAWQVLTGSKTWVGYCSHAMGLPPIRAAVLASNGITIDKAGLLEKAIRLLMDQRYASYYEWITDAKLLVRNWRSLGG